MTDKSTTPPEKQRREQLGKKALQEMIRPYAKEAILKAVKLMDCGNENVQLGAVKLLLAKVLPDLKSTDLTSEEGVKLLIEIIGDNRLRDANPKPEELEKGN